MSITLISSSASDGNAIRVTVPTMKGGVNTALAELSLRVTVEGLISPSVTVSSRSNSGMESLKSKVFSPSVATNFTVI